MQRETIIGAACAMLLAALAAQADDVDRGRDLARDAAKAYDAGNYAQAAGLYRAALTARPTHPGLMLQFAKASARAGAANDALATLEEYAAMGLLTDPAAGDLAVLKDHPRMAAIRARIDENAKPRGAPDDSWRVSKPLLIEGIAFRDHSVVASSVSGRSIEIAGFDSDATLVRSGTNGLMGAFGMAFDPLKNLLWVASSGVPQAANLQPSERGRAGVFSFDPKQGKPRDAVLLPQDGKDHVLGDLAIAPNGDVFASDSSTPAVYRLTAGGNTLELFALSDEFHSPQGLAFSSDGSKLAVADYANGIHIIDMASKVRTLAPAPPHTTLLGIDGLVRYGRDLIGVQNGVDPQRVVLLRLNPTWSSIESVEVLAANLPVMSEPSLAAVNRKTLWVVGNAQWSHFSDDGKLTKPLEPTRLLQFELPPARQ